MGITFNFISCSFSPYILYNICSNHDPSYVECNRTYLFGLKEIKTDTYTLFALQENCTLL